MVNLDFLQVAAAVVDIRMTVMVVLEVMVGAVTEVLRVQQAVEAAVADVDSAKSTGICGNQHGLGGNRCGISLRQCS